MNNTDFITTSPTATRLAQEFSCHDGSTAFDDDSILTVELIVDQTLVVRTFLWGEVVVVGDDLLFPF
eukprot:m.356704 g.356704  ORF g.356704 m.356704 type:complete len:67 (+) comp16605_c2_seq2:790-990(+)